MKGAFRILSYSQAPFLRQLAGTFDLINSGTCSLYCMPTWDKSSGTVSIWTGKRISPQYKSKNSKGLHKPKLLYTETLFGMFLAATLGTAARINRHPLPRFHSSGMCCLCQVLIIGVVLTVFLISGLCNLAPHRLMNGSISGLGQGPRRSVPLPSPLVGPLRVTPQVSAGPSSA